MLLTWGEAFTEVHNDSEFSIILVLGKEGASVAVTCVYMDYKRLVEPGKCRTGAKMNNSFYFDKRSVLFKSLLISQRL